MRIQKQKKLLQKTAGTFLLAFALTVLPLEAVTPFSTASTAEAVAKISASRVTLAKGEKKTLKITGTGKAAKWSSSDKTVASVSSKGVVTARKKGKATVTAKVGSKKYTCRVTVQVPKLNKTTASLNVGGTCRLKLSDTSQKLKWKSSNKSVATVDSSGEVTAKRVGTATITAKAGKKSYKCKVTVKQNAPVTAAQACDTLKEYILKYGSSDQKGNKKIEMKQDKNEITYKWSIAYRAGTDDFQYVLEADNKAALVAKHASDDYFYCLNGEKALMDIGIYVSANAQKSTEAGVSFIWQSSCGTSFATGAFAVNQYKKGSAVSFTVQEKAESLAEADMNKKMNIWLETGFEGWQRLLMETVGITMKDMGFTSCQ